jgi:hypothetical protein
MGDNVEEETITKADFNILLAQMQAMMEQMKTNNEKLEPLSSGGTSTAPPKPADTDKGDPLEKGKPTDESDPKRGRRGPRTLPRRVVLLGDTRSFHTLRAISPEGTSKCHK